MIGGKSMKVKDGFVIRSIAGNSIVVPVGARVVNFRGIMNLNEAGAFIFEQIKEEISYEELLKRMLDEYDADKETIQSDLDEFLNTAMDLGVI